MFRYGTVLYGEQISVVLGGLVCTLTYCACCVQLAGRGLLVEEMQLARADGLAKAIEQRAKNTNGRTRKLSQDWDNFPLTQGIGIAQ